jgi:hypothetical protein
MNHWIETTATLDLWQIAVANLLLAGSMTALVMALWGSFSNWRADRNLGAMCAVVGLAFVLRVLIAPKWMATVFIGYKATQQAIELFPLSHYGAGATVLYHHLLEVFGRDHLVIMWSNTVMGIMTIPLAMTFARRMTQSTRVGLVFGLLVATAPLLIRNDTSDANNVPCLLWLFCGLTLLVRALEERDRWFLWWSCFPLALAVVSRPEMIAIVGGGVFVTMVASPGTQDRRRWTIDALFFVPFLASAIPHWMHIWRATKALHQGGNIKTVDSLWGHSEWGHSFFGLFRNNTLLEPSLLGVGTLIVALGGTVLLWRNHKRWLMGMWALVVVAFVVYSIDLDRANMARAHAPAALFCTLLAAHGLVEISSRWKRLWVVVVLAWALVLGSNIPPLMTLWQPTNEQTEEELIREALQRVEPSGFTLIRLNYPDTDRAVAAHGGHTHYHFPDYLFQTEERRGRLVPITAWMSENLGYEEYPTYFFRGVRCYAELGWEFDPPPSGRNEHPLCRAMLDREDIKPVFERTIPNYGNVWINYYGDSPELVVGLYRVGPKQDAPK